MSKNCPQCGTLNDDKQKFCTSCGNSLDVLPDQSGSSTKPSKGPVSSGAPRDPNPVLKIVIGAGIVVIILIIIFLMMTNSGIPGMSPSFAAPVTTRPPATPVVTSYIMVETPAPAPITTGNLSVPTTIPDTTPASPTPTKAVVCPSDRRACGANCTDTMTDRSNCGACAVSCGSSQICQQGRCMARCSFGETNCPDGCFNLSYNAQHCGTCSNTCPVGLGCNRSICTPPDTTVIPTYSG
jgi:hypothetical protein